MNIGDVAEASGLPAKTIRYYEEIGLVRPKRGENGYRSFNEADVHKLAFLSRARSLGFSIEDCRSLMSLYEDRGRASANVKTIASDHLERITSKITELESLRRTLKTLIHRCHGDKRPDCPILDDLSGHEPPE
jgi:MerR family transcriptional regulator, copper efflux regulator